MQYHTIKSSLISAQNFSRFFSVSLEILNTSPGRLFIDLSLERRDRLLSLVDFLSNFFQFSSSLSLGYSSSQVTKINCLGRQLLDQESISLGTGDDLAKVLRRVIREGVEKFDIFERARGIRLFSSKRRSSKIVSNGLREESVNLFWSHSGS